MPAPPRRWGVGSGLWPLFGASAVAFVLVGCGQSTSVELASSRQSSEATQAASQAEKLSAANRAAKAKQSTSENLPQSDGDPRAIEITEQMLKAYRQAKSYADNAVYVQHYALRGEGVQRNMPFFQMSLAFERPAKLRLRFEEAVAGATQAQAYEIACDGETLYCSAAALPGQVAQVTAPEALTLDNVIPDPLLRSVLLERGIENVFPQLAMLLSGDDEQPIFPQDENPQLLNDEEFAGRRCYRVATTSPSGQRVLWIDAETMQLLRMELPIEKERGILDPDNAYMELGVAIEFLDSSFDASLMAETFRMEIPESTRRVKTLVKGPLPGISAVADEDAKNRELLAAAVKADASGTSLERLQQQLEAFYVTLDEATQTGP